MRIRSNRARLAARGVAAGILILAGPGRGGAATLTVEAAARHAGGYGLAVEIGDGAPAFVRDDTPILERNYRARFYLRADGLIMSEGDEFDLLRTFDAGDVELLALSLLRQGGGYLLRWRLLTDSGTVSTAPGAELPVGPGWRAIELAWRGGASGVPDGELRLWIDGGGEGSPDFALAGVENTDARVDYVVLGAAAGIDGGTGGELALDDFVSRRNGYIGAESPFVDVAVGSPAWAPVQALYDLGLSQGCAVGAFCPDDPVTRQQMAVFALRAAQGSGVAPSGCGGPPFPDVLPANPFCPWIQALQASGIADTCAGGAYCPESSVTRAQVVSFLLRALEGSGYAPTDCTAAPFPDVDPEDPLCPWIQEAASPSRDISDGCGGGNYCPADPVTRIQLALLLARAFGMELPAP